MHDKYDDEKIVINRGGGSDGSGPKNGTGINIGRYIKEFKEELDSVGGIDKLFVMGNNFLKLETLVLFLFSQEPIGVVIYCIVNYVVGNDNSTNSTNGP